MLGQPGDVRRAYVLAVIDEDGGTKEQTMWMLRQPDAVRRSYIDDVLLRQ